MIKTLLTISLLQLAITITAQTYHLEAVTTVENNERYVFLQDNYVMGNTLVNKALQTAADYQTEQLTGSESYVWRLVSANSSKPLYTLQNCSLESNSYLSYSNSGLSFSSSSKASQWYLTFQSDGTLVILTKDQNRCLAYTSATIHQYKLYSANIDGTPYDENPGYLTVYRLVSDTPVDGITPLTFHHDTPKTYFDLQGRQVSRPTRGLYIVNGRKVIMH